MSLIKIKNNEEHTRTLLMSMPNGKVFERKFDTDSNLYKFWTSISKTFILLEEDFNRLFDELNPITCEETMRLWEEEYGIPDTIFKGNGTLEERRRDILAKVSASGLITNKNFVDFFAFIGYDVIIYNGATAFKYGLKFPTTFGQDNKISKFIIVVKFGEAYPNLDDLKLFVQEIVPANVRVIFN